MKTVNVERWLSARVGGELVPPGTLAVSGAMFGWHIVGGGVLPHSGVKARDAAKHPAICRRVPVLENHPAPNVTTSEFEKP